LYRFADEPAIEDRDQTHAAIDCTARELSAVEATRLADPLPSRRSDRCATRSSELEPMLHAPANAHWKRIPTGAPRAARAPESH
jgi:hypothetical protein